MIDVESRDSILSAMKEERDSWVRTFGKKLYFDNYVSGNEEKAIKAISKGICDNYFDVFNKYNKLIRSYINTKGERKNIDLFWTEERIAKLVRDNINEKVDTLYDNVYITINHSAIW